MNSAINYLSSVLGISGVIGTYARGNTALNKTPLFVSVLRSLRPSLLALNEASILFDKMLAAIGFKRDKIEFLEVNEVTITDLKVWTEKHSLVVILDKPEQSLLSIQPHIIWSYHPQELLINGSLKKLAWEHLKRLSLGGLNG
ncbi:MAG: hypothetical protein SGJ18_08370 [Pseudomonadota bacterium]|nr:hypothetical protein [Pseudomonadota bacterium]